MPPTDADVRALIDETYRTESRRVFASLVRLVRDFDLAEEALHEAFAAAVERWPRDGVPDNPRAWLVSDRPVQGDRRPPPPRPLRRPPAGTRRPAGGGRRGQRRPGGPGDRGRPAAARLRLLPPGHRPDGAGAAHAAGGVRADDRGDRRGVPDRPGDDGPADRPRARPRSATPASRSPSRPPTTCRSGSGRCWRSSTWCSTRGTRPPPARRSRGPTCRARRSAWAGWWSNCCPTRRPSACSR